MDFKLGITKEFPCNYIPEQQERLLIVVDENMRNDKAYTWLMHQGFRRSGDQVYRPHCQECTKCHSVRVPVNDFTPSKSQKRLLNKSKEFTLKVNSENKPEYYELYENYINAIHYNGAMYPATPEQYQGFVNCNICEQLFIELWHKGELISVAVTDVLGDGLSAVYTFYHPDYRKYGLGVVSILKQIEQSKVKEKQFLYLGYQIDTCQKMNYKTKFFPHHRLINNQWFLVNK